MNKLSIEKQVQIINLLVEGNSMRATARIADCSFNTVKKLLADIGNACAEYQNKAMRRLNCEKIQCDEIWSFCHSKEKNVPEEKKGILGFGDVYTWTAIDAKTKLVPSFLVGKRDTSYAKMFINDLALRLTHRVQLTTDGHKAYLEAVETSFGGNIDYAMLVKLYGNEEGKGSEKRYSASEFTGAKKTVVSGKPDIDSISTSFVERQNLTMRMSMRRFTRLTNGFSKKIEYLEYAVALHFMYYNFARIHKTLRVTPAMEARITDHLWSLEEIIALYVEKPKKRGKYKIKISN